MNRGTTNNDDARRKIGAAPTTLKTRMPLLSGRNSTPSCTRSREAPPALVRSWFSELRTAVEDRRRAIWRVGNGRAGGNDLTRIEKLPEWGCSVQRYSRNVSRPLS